MSTLERQVRDANRKVFDDKSFDEYQTNPSIFEPQRQAEIESILKSESGRAAILDIGCGTGNILRLARRHYGGCFGLDISVRLLSELKRRERDFGLAMGEAVHLPYRANTFRMVTLYGVLHHLVDHRSVFREVFRVLSPGGAVYTDHDPNYFFGRFYHLYYRMRYLHRPGFGTDEAELSEYHHTRTGGLNPLRIQDDLVRCGFSDVDVRFRMTTNPTLAAPFRAARFVLSQISRLIPFRSCYTHFWIRARKR